MRVLKLNCNAEDPLCVSSSSRYNLTTAHEMGVKDEAFVMRKHEPSPPYYVYVALNLRGH